MNEEDYMRMALQLARKGMGRVNPNPLVGAIVVKAGAVIGSGFHERYGEAHAERNALNRCKVSPEGSVMYVTLEPCCHYGRTPPCTQAIVESKVKKVVVGCLDPNEKVAGKGIRILQEAGIEVSVGVLEKECQELNEIFFHFIKMGTPYVLMKYAMTLDGKIATTESRSKWIRNEESREHVHKTRNQYSAIMVGVGTIMADDPELTCRLEDSRNPIRIICDSKLSTSLDSKVALTASVVKTLIATTIAEEALHKPYLDLGMEVIVTQRECGRVNLRELMKLLGARGIDSILLEGGGSLHFSALDSEIVSKLHGYIAPKIFGGETAKSPVMGRGFADVNNKIKLQNTKVQSFGKDILVESEVTYVHRNH